MATVFVTQENPLLDFEPARLYGDRIIAVFPPGQVLLSPQHALERAYKMLCEMRPGDSLALVGDPIIIGMCVSIASELMGTVRLLRWNKRSYSYSAVDVDFPRASRAHILRGELNHA